jgi:hypothetical protein
MSQLVRTDAIRSRAFELWEAAGRPEGGALDYWLAAESELKAKAPALQVEHGSENIRPAERGGDMQTESGRIPSTAGPDSDAPAQRRDKTSSKGRSERGQSGGGVGKSRKTSAAEDPAPQTVNRPGFDLGGAVGDAKPDSSGRPNRLATRPQLDAADKKRPR